MSAILFGSISTIADTSELQRQAFNRAFELHGLDWHWPREEYITMLGESGGRKRIDRYAASVGQSVDAEAIHQSKSKIFQESLTEGQVQPRSGVVETIQGAKKNGLKVALVTTTSEQNVSSLIEALSPSIRATDFDKIVSAADVKRSKPAKDAYVFVLEQLDEGSDSCVAIEDNVDGVEAAISANLDCVAFPNENTADDDFSKANLVVNRLDFDELQQMTAS